MYRLITVAVMSPVATGCSCNKSFNEPNVRIRDTTLTARYTTHPTDTLPRIRHGDPARVDSVGR